VADSTSIPVVLPSRDMTTDEFKRWYARLGLNQSQLAKRLDVDERKPKRRARRPSEGADET
jgi:hypothetical protein